MANISEKEIVKFLKDSVEPLDDYIYGSGYRASAYLNDGTFLPCVIFRNPATLVNLAMKRFKEELSGKSVFRFNSGAGYYNIVKNFVANGNCIDYYDIKKVELSRFAFSIDTLKQIHGETTMGWTGFVVKMTDGRHFGFGTSFKTEFFNLPEGYVVENIDKIINHSYLSIDGVVRSHKVPYFETPENYSPEIIFREKPFFECYIDAL